MIHDLPRTHLCRYGVPAIAHVDSDIFVKRYFTRCMECTFCSDKCCEYGVDIDLENVARLRAQGEALELFTGVPQERWFTDEIYEDAHYPGGKATRTQADQGGCVFRCRTGRGCMLHSYALDKGIDYHEFKPIISALFPITFDRDTLFPSVEVTDESLICLGSGPTLYQAMRDELRYYFGDALVEDLDRVELSITSTDAR